MAEYSVLHSDVARLLIKGVVDCCDIKFEVPVNAESFIKRAINADDKVIYKAKIMKDGKEGFLLLVTEKQFVSLLYLMLVYGSL